MCKGLSIDDVGVSRDAVFQEIRPGAGFGFETGDFVKEELGGLPYNDSPEKSGAPSTTPHQTKDSLLGALPT